MAKMRSHYAEIFLFLPLLFAAVVSATSVVPDEGAKFLSASSRGFHRKFRPEENASQHARSVIGC